MSLANLVRLFFAMTMEILHHECRPLRPIFAFFAILGQVGNTISPWGEGRSRMEVVMFVANDQQSIALEFRIGSSSLAGVMQLMVRTTLSKFVFLAVFCPVVRQSPRGTASHQRVSKPNPDAQDWRGY